MFVAIIVSAILGSYAIMQVKWYADLLATGHPSPPYPRPYGGLLLVPNTNPGFIESRSLGADFSQVYFAALAVRNGESGYNPATSFYKDRFGRPPAYPPFTNWMYQILTFLPYAQALLVHTLVGFVVFFSAIYFALQGFGARRYLWPIVGVSILLFLFTPIGLFHLERGQFEIFVTAAFLLFMSCLFRERGGFLVAILCGILASIKWSSLPFLSTFGFLILLASDAHRREKIAIMAVVMIGLLALFPSQLLEYLQVVRHYEVEVTAPLGESYQYLMPSALAKAVPLISMLIIAGLLLRLDSDERRNKFMSAAFPMALAFAMQGIGFGTIMHEYHSFDLVAFLPFLPFWLDRTTVTFKAKRCLVVFYALLLVFMFRAPNILFWLKLDIRTVQPTLLAAVLLAGSIAILGFAALILIHPQKNL